MTGSAVGAAASQTSSDHRDLDAAFLGITDETVEGFEVTITSDLCRPGGFLYGGMATATAAVAMERRSQRDIVWVTAQFLATAPLGAIVSVKVGELVRGRRISQMTVSATDQSGTVLFLASGATRVPADTVIDSPQFSRMPDVPDPEQCPRVLTAPDLAIQGWPTTVEVRLAARIVGDDPTRLCLWLRQRDPRPWTAARLAFSIDMIPMALALACGRTGGSSLDNTFRALRTVDTDWILLDFRPHGAVDGFGSGEVLVWSRGGVLMATEAQTSSLLDTGRDLLQ